MTERLGWGLSIYAGAGDLAKLPACGRPFDEIDCRSGIVKVSSPAGVADGDVIAVVRK